MKTLKCGDSLVISALPSTTLYVGGCKVRAYYCPTHHDYYPVKERTA